jgi:hypothetical protein
MAESRYYYVNTYTKVVRHASQELEPIPEGYEFCGMSQMPIKGAAGYYTKNQAGFTIVDHDVTPVIQESETANDV